MIVVKLDLLLGVSMPPDIQRTLRDMQPVHPYYNTIVLNHMRMQEDDVLVFFERSADQVEIYGAGADFLKGVQPRHQSVKTSTV